MVAGENAVAHRMAAEFSQRLVARLTAEAARLKADFGEPDPTRVRCCWLDDVLPQQVIEAARRNLPDPSTMVRRENMKERKFVSANLDALASPIGDLVLAIAQQPVADAVARIMGKPKLEVDPLLYNGGVTAMMPGDFMCPHLDNSHDYARVRRREVVLLFYLSAEWHDEYGGGLELWDRKRGGTARPIAFRPNRLVIMETTERSWHSIRSVVGPVPRVSLTTYFYAPAAEKAPLRLTRFTSWPGHPLRGLLFDSEFHARGLAAKLIGRRVGRNRHAYRPATPPATGSGPVAPEPATRAPEHAQNGKPATAARRPEEVADRS
jgi:hypothetical protein